VRIKAASVGASVCSVSASSNGRRFLARRRLVERRQQLGAHQLRRQKMERRRVRSGCGLLDDQLCSAVNVALTQRRSLGDRRNGVR
jgi:hypothetical protein